nr:PREDICTED: epidermal growth factor-like protein 7 [Struthio camelus australis]
MHQISCLLAGLVFILGVTGTDGFARAGRRACAAEAPSRPAAVPQSPKLQLVLAPFHNLMPSAPDDVGADPISRLSHSLQQLDRIDSLSEQISFLEERLGACSLSNPWPRGTELGRLATVSRCRPARSVTHVPLLIYIALQTQQPVINKR